MLNVFICIVLLLVCICICCWEIQCIKKSLSGIISFMERMYTDMETKNRSDAGRFKILEDSNNILRDMIIEELRKGNETAENLDK